MAVYPAATPFRGSSPSSTEPQRLSTAFWRAGHIVDDSLTIFPGAYARSWNTGFERHATEALMPFRKENPQE